METFKRRTRATYGCMATGQSPCMVVGQQPAINYYEVTDLILFEPP